MAWTLAVLSERLQGLVDEGHIVLINVETEQAQATSGTATDAVQELQSLCHQIVVGLVVLVPQVVLQHAKNIWKIQYSSLIHKQKSNSKCIFSMKIPTELPAIHTAHHIRSTQILHKKVIKEKYVLTHSVYI